MDIAEIMYYNPTHTNKFKKSEKRLDRCGAFWYFTPTQLHTNTKVLMSKGSKVFCIVRVRPDRGDSERFWRTQG